MPRSRSVRTVPLTSTTSPTLAESFVTTTRSSVPSRLEPVPSRRCSQFLPMIPEENFTTWPRTVTGLSLSFGALPTIPATVWAFAPFAFSIFTSGTFGACFAPACIAPRSGAAWAPAPAAKPIKVDKASGPDARTVAEVVTGKAGLKDKSVLVRAQVVKVNTGIMGKNWLHLRDGSGSAADGSNDILVTTRDIAALGDVVSVKGTVRTDVNLGSGYTYAVLIEDAAVRK